MRILYNCPQDVVRQERKRRDAILEANADPARMASLRSKVIAQAKKYFGVPYAKKYWAPGSKYTLLINLGITAIKFELKLGQIAQNKD